MLAVAALAMSVPQSGIAPELSPAWRAEQDFLANWRGVRPLAPIAEATSTLKRMAVRERPARKIDDALRRRAFEAVERALEQSPPV
jgi:hypothetical protein